jgi:hypothetical protein
VKQLKKQNERLLSMNVNLNIKMQMMKGKIKHLKNARKTQEPATHTMVKVSAYRKTDVVDALPIAVAQLRELFEGEGQFDPHSIYVRDAMQSVGSGDVNAKQRHEAETIHAVHALVEYIRTQDTIGSMPKRVSDRGVLLRQPLEGGRLLMDKLKEVTKATVSVLCIVKLSFKCMYFQGLERDI